MHSFKEHRGWPRLFLPTRPTTTTSRIHTCPFFFNYTATTQIYTRTDTLSLHALFRSQGQDLAGGSHESEAGTADGRADEALPKTVDKRQAPVAECVQNIARDQDPFRTETIEERTRRERYHCGRAHDRRQHQPRGRRREAADRVEIDDLEGKDQSGAEVVERVPALKNEDGPR